MPPTRLLISARPPSEDSERTRPTPGRPRRPGTGIPVNRPDGGDGFPRIALVTLSANLRERGGVEVVNEQIRQALGNVEIFDEGPALQGWPVGDFHRVGLDQPRRALAAARVFRTRHREEPFDLVISNGVAGWPLGFARLSIPMIQVYHLTFAGLSRQALTLRGDRITSGHVTAFFDRWAGVGKHVVTVSPRVLREVESYYRLRGRWIPPGIDTSLFSPVERAAARDVLELPRDRPIGIFAGRPDRSKGYDILLQVARRCPDVLFLVAGGTTAPRDNVRPIGRIPHSKMPLWYAASDVLVNPSRYEGFNLVILEALSCDRPVIASAAAFSIPEDPSRCGFVVPGERIEDYVTAIRRILQADPLHPREVVVPRYSFERFASSWRELVTTLIGPKEGPWDGRVRSALPASDPRELQAPHG